MKPKLRHRVLMLVENNSFPQDIRVFAETQTLISNSYQVSVISPAKPGQPLYEKINGIYTFRYPSLPQMNNILNYFLEYGWSLVAMFYISLRVCIYPGFDIIHTANPPDILVLLAFFYKLFGKRFIYDHHDLAPELFYARFEGKGNKFIYQWLVWFERLSCRCADHIITTNESYKALEIQRSQVKEDRITIVRNGPLERLCHIEPQPGLRQDGEVIIAYMGVIGRQDGVDHLIKAIHYLVYNIARTDFLCLVIGDGDDLPFIKSLTSELELTDYVLFTGWIDHSIVTRYLSVADICVAPEPSNPYNDRCTVVKLMEYMALEKPVVAFDLPEHHVTVGDGALYARPNEDSDFAQKITLLMDDPELRMNMGRIGRDRIKNELAWSHQEKFLLKAYETLNPSLSLKRS